MNAWRVFSAVSQQVKSNRALTEIVNNAAMRANFTGENYVRPIGIGVHFVKQLVDTANPIATVSPNVMHQDGELFDYVYLIERSNVVGGVNYIASVDAKGADPEQVPVEKVIRKFTLEHELDGFGVLDKSVCHGVTPIQLKKEENEGHRLTMLVDLTPMYEKLW